MEEAINIESYFYSLSAVAGLVVIIFQFINDKLLKYPLNATWTQVSTWILAVALAFLAGWRDWGIFAELNAWWTLAYGVAAGLIANGLFELSVVQSILEFIKLLTNKKKD